MTRPISAMVPWYGSNRMLAREVGVECGTPGLCVVPFAGSLCEVGHIKAREFLINDLHRDLINLARVVSTEDGTKWLQEQIEATPFHQDVLESAQQRIKHLRQEQNENRGTYLWGSATTPPQVNAEQWALDYFICCWMARAETAGTKGELDSGISIRYGAGGGGSVTRFRNAAKALADWRKLLTRAAFSTDDARDVIAKSLDGDGKGVTIYCDLPFPGPGDKYLHPSTTKLHHDVAKLWAVLWEEKKPKHHRVVMRYYDDPLIRELYSEGKWTWRYLTGRDQHNNDTKPEVLILSGRGRSYSSGGGGA